MIQEKRIRRQHLLREAQGYLELALLFADCWSLDQHRIEVLAERSLDSLDELEKRFGSSVRTLYLKGEVYRLLEKYSQAIFFLQEANRIEPNNADALLALGWCYKRTGRLDLAVASLEEAIEIDYSLGIAHYNLACYWSLAGQAQLAIKHLSIAFDIEPDYRQYVAEESDFDSIRCHPGFQTLTALIV